MEKDNNIRREKATSKIKATDFCGIWRESDLGMTAEELISEIKSHRSVRREVDEDLN